MALGGINPGAKSKSRIRYNWARVTKGATALSLHLNSPLTVDENGNLSIGIGSGLTLGGSNISVVVDESTLTIANNTLSIKNGGVGLTQLGALTAKGQLLTYTTVPAVLSVGLDGQALIANSTASSGLSWSPIFSNPMTADLDAGNHSLSNISAITVNDGGSVIAGVGTGLTIASGASQKLGFWGATPIVRPALTGSRATGAALVSLIAAGVAMGLWTDSTTT